MPSIWSTILRLTCLLPAAALIAQETPPVIGTQPKNQSVSLGANVTFRITVSPAAGTGIQWRHDDSEVANGTNAALSLTNVTLAAGGNYWAVALNAAGSVTSKVATLNIDPAFTKVTTGSIATDGGDSSGSAWGDYNGDGFPDLFVGNGNTKNFLYRNNGDGTFTKDTNAAPAKDSGFGGSWGDFDNDGKLDLFVGNRSFNYLYRNNGDGTFTKVTTFAGSSGSTSWSGSWGDYDRDGWLDLFISNGGGANNVLLHNNGDGTFTRITTGRIVKDGGASIGAAWQDYDGDGWPDLYVANNGNALGFLYHNLRDSTFARVTTGRVALDTQSGIVPDWGDYDNDGWPDLAVAVFGRCLLYRNLGEGTFGKITTGPVVTDTQNSEILLWADYDNDGFLDLFSANASSQNNALYRNNGDGTFAKIITGSVVNDGGDSAGAAWTDYDNDGFQDLFVANWNGSRPNFIYRNNGNTNHWLKVRCVGSASNRSGIGARVRVTATFRGQRVTQLREISGGTGFGQSEVLAHFGLADAVEVEGIRVEWPSGTVQTLGPVPANQKVVVHEPAHIRHLERVENGWRLEFQGVPQAGYRLEAGNGLSNWQPAANAEELSAPGSFRVTVPATDGNASGFFRVVEL